MNNIIPTDFRSLQPFMRLGEEHRARDPVISYYCKLHTLQEGMKINKSSKDCLVFLSNLMDELEKIKLENKQNEAFSNDIIGQAYIEAYALKLFVFADTEDRNCHFNKNVVKAFFSASILFDVLSLFGPPADEIDQQRKYAKWKATYLNDCLKKNVEPVPGPPTDNSLFDNIPSFTNNNLSETSTQSYSNNLVQDTNGTLSSAKNMELPAKPQMLQLPKPNLSTLNLPLQNEVSPNDSKIDPIELANAEKMCKYAYSALQYQDITTAIKNLQQCLAILQKYEISP